MSLLSFASALSSAMVLAPAFLLLTFSSSSSLCFFIFISGLDSGNFDVNMHGVRGPFAPSQWLELERQALIYKYIVAYVAIPPNLLIPIRTSLSPSGFSPFSVGSFGSSTCKAFHTQEKDMYKKWTKTIFWHYLINPIWLISQQKRDLFFLLCEIFIVSKIMFGNSWTWDAYSCKLHVSMRCLFLQIACFYHIYLLFWFLISLNDI